MAKTLWVSLGLAVAAISILYNPTAERLEVLGATRPFSKIVNIHGQGLRLIENTQQCEDIHVHLPSKLLFSGCQASNPEKRHSWFPPNAVFTNPKDAGEGGIYVVNPADFTSQKLELKGYAGPFVTHGIEIYWDEKDPDSVYVFVVNHLPNPAYYASKRPGFLRWGTLNEKARSQIEIFHHVIGSKEAEHLRSVRHPLIRMPNDILALSPTSFYTTNDHYYREGFLRLYENLVSGMLAPWSDTVHVEVTDIDSPDPTTGITVAVALKNMHNNNGLGHAASGKIKGEVQIIDAGGGRLYRAKLVSDGKQPFPTFKFLERIQLASTLDNPSYYDDPYPEVGGDASGYLLAGLGRGLDLGAHAFVADALDPVMVWHVRPKQGGGWDKNLIFQDNGTTIRSASSAVLVGIDPKLNDGKKQAWLFVTGFVSHAMVATKVNL